MKKIGFLFLTITLFFGCSTTGGLINWYDAYYDENILPEECKLLDNEEPEIYYTDNYEADSLFLRSNYFDILGCASYNGPAEDLVVLENNIRYLCKQKKATIALYTYDYTDTRSGVVNYSGYVSSYSIKRYDYHIVLFFPLPLEYIEKQIIGIEVLDIDSELRLRLKRNTGVYVDVVYIDSPAFYANLVHGDVITKINKIDIVNKTQFNDVVSLLQPGDPITVTFVRNGTEQTIEFIL